MLVNRADAFVYLVTRVQPNALDSPSGKSASQTQRTSSLSRVWSVANKVGGAVRDFTHDIIIPR